MRIELALYVVAVEMSLYHVPVLVEVVGEERASVGDSAIEGSVDEHIGPHDRPVLPVGDKDDDVVPLPITVVVEHHEGKE